MIDIHSHILPGIDDGAADMDETLQMLRIAADSGVTAMIATPHCNIPGIYENYFGDEYVRRFRQVDRAIREAGIPIEIYPGMEVFATPDLARRLGDGQIMPLNQSHYLLMEFSFQEDPAFAWHVLHQVSRLGVIPVIAHAERYDFVQEEPQIAYDWRREGYLIQVNKGSVLGRFGRRARRAAYQLLDHNLVTAVASDAHGPVQRTPCLSDAYEELMVDYPEPYLRALFEENPRRICEDKPVKAFSPVSFEEWGG